MSIKELITVRSIEMSRKSIVRSLNRFLKILNIIVLKLLLSIKTLLNQKFVIVEEFSYTQLSQEEVNQVGLS